MSQIDRRAFIAAAGAAAAVPFSARAQVPGVGWTSKSPGGSVAGPVLA
jgi:hypothetical protein